MTAKNNHPELIEKLAEGISNLTTSEEWQRYLDCQSRFHRYSFGNVLLIAAQCHEATQVAGFNAWRKFNRFVRKGEKAIFILAPMVYKNADAANGEDERVIRGFKFVPVFDVAQTDGEELPSICNRLDGEDPAGHYAQLLSVAQSLGFTVVDHEFDGSTNGDCNHAEHRIRVEVRNTPAQRVKTLAHELLTAPVDDWRRRLGTVLFAHPGQGGRSSAPCRGRGPSEPKRYHPVIGGIGWNGASDRLLGGSTHDR